MRRIGNQIKLLTTKNTQIPPKTVPCMFLWQVLHSCRRVAPSWLRPCYSCPQRCCRCRHSSSNALHLRPGAPRPDALLHQGAPEAEEEEEEEEEEDQRETNPTILEVLRWTLHRRRTSAAPSPTLRIGSSFSRASIGRRLTSCERSVRSGRAAVWRRAA